MLAGAAQLIRHTFGNFVVQHILEHGPLVGNGVFLGGDGEVRFLKSFCMFFGDWELGVRFVADFVKRIILQKA